MPKLSEIVALSKIFGYDGVANAAAAFRQLSVEGGRALAVEFMDTNPAERETEDFLLRLGAFVPGSLVDVQDRLVDRKILWPTFLLSGASPSVRDRLLSAIEQPDANVNRLLMALAWIGDDVVVDTFDKWKSSVPTWANYLNVTADRYTLEAGWTMTAGGKRRDLYHTTCHPLIKPDADAMTIESGAAVDIQSPQTALCGWCGQKLVNLLDIDLTCPEVGFLGFSGRRLNIASCVRCTGYCTIFTDIDFHGKSIWRDDNEKPSYNGGDGGAWEFETMRWTIGPPRRSPFEAHPSIMYRGASQLGGFPSWEQDADFPNCPQCKQYMTFVGQLAGSDLYEYGEGFTYAFVCAECGTAGTVYQQT